MIFVMPIGWLEFSCAGECAKVFGGRQALFFLAQILKDDVDPEKFFACGGFSIGTKFRWIAGCDLSLTHHHLQVIVNHHLSGGHGCGQTLNLRGCLRSC